jgi:hypothetical protein
MQSLIWFLTDTDFSKEWGESSILGKIRLCYVTFGFIFFEILSFGLIFSGLKNLIAHIL